jgi:hypothetical protein
MSPSLDDLHPAQNRAFRELYAACRLVTEHYRSLARVTGEEAFADAAGEARRLLDQLAEQTKRYGLYGYPAAQGVGANAARLQISVPNRFLERNQALRVAVLDLQHVVTLLAYLGNASETNGNADLAEFCRGWESTLLESEKRVRDAAAEQGRRDLDGAVDPLYDDAGGRAGHKVQLWVGAFGEWFDRRAARRRS